jgi:hypothetical protein
MKLKKQFQLPFMALLCLLLLVPSISRAAEKINFSGEWTLNESKSEIGEGRFRPSTKISVKQKENILVIERTRSGRNGQTRVTTDELTLDGKVVESKSEYRSSKTTAAWSDKGNSLTIESDMVMSRQGQTFEMKRVEIWQLSGDGNTLTIQSSTSSSRGERSARLVYDKKM